MHLLVDDCQVVSPEALQLPDRRPVRSSCESLVDGSGYAVVEGQTAGAHGVDVPTISELVLTQHEALGLTYREMADRAALAGFRVKYQTIQELATRTPKQWPKASATIRGLAEALQVSQRTVVLAFARSFGLDVSSDASLLELLLPAGTRDVHPGLQQAIAGVVRAAIDTGSE